MDFTITERSCVCKFLPSENVKMHQRSQNRCGKTSVPQHTTMKLDDHPSYSRYLHILTVRFYWNSVARSVRRYVASCTVWQTQKLMRSKIAYVQPKPVPSRPMTHLIIDPVGQLSPSNENCCIFAHVCNSASFVYCQAIEKPHRRLTCKTIAKKCLYDADSAQFSVQIKDPNSCLTLSKVKFLTSGTLKVASVDLTLKKTSNHNSKH